MERSEEVAMVHFVQLAKESYESDG